MNIKNKPEDKVEFLFEVNDTEKIKMGTKLHLPHIGIDGRDWSTEAMLWAIEIAHDNGIKIPKRPNDYDKWDYYFNCIVNGVKYNVRNTYDGLNCKLKISKIN